MKEIFETLCRNEDLSAAQATRGFEMILSGEASAPAIGAFLGMLAQKGESVTEIFSGMKVMHDKALKIIAAPEAMDIVGTGGDGLNSYNVSTTAALIVAACGVPIAKHGSRAVSSKSGASDVLTALGVDIHAPIEVMQKSLDTVGISFMFAPFYHKAVGNVMPARQAIGIRTIFNFLGPICNPASVKRLLLGTSEMRLLEPYAEILIQNGCDRFMVVTAENQMDELSLSCATHIMRYDGQNLERLLLTPEDIGLTVCAQEALTGGEPAHNAQMLKNILSGSEQGPCRDIVLLNSAAALWVADKIDDFKQGVAMAQTAIDSGAAMQKLQDFVAATAKL